MVITPHHNKRATMVSASHTCKSGGRRRPTHCHGWCPPTRSVCFELPTLIKGGKGGFSNNHVPQSVIDHPPALFRHSCGRSLPLQEIWQGAEISQLVILRASEGSRQAMTPSTWAQTSLLWPRSPRHARQQQAGIDLSFYSYCRPKVMK